jgi:hypothetical protein
MDERSARSPDFEHFGTAFRALAFGCGAAILHCDLDRVLDLAFGFAFDAIGFCCHLGFLQSA